MGSSGSSIAGFLLKGSYGGGSFDLSASLRLLEDCCCFCSSGSESDSESDKEKLTNVLRRFGGGGGVSEEVVVQNGFWIGG